MDPSKRRTLQTLAGLGALAALPRAWAQVRAVDLRDTPVSRAYDLTVAETPLNVTGKPAQGITINGLTILNEWPTLDTYFEANVTGGEDSFVIPANDYESYGEAILRKLLREITGPGIS